VRRVAAGGGRAVEMTEEKNPPKTKSGDFSLPWKAQKTKARFPHSHRPGYGCYTFSESNPRKELPPPPSRLFPRLILRLEKTARPAKARVKSHVCHKSSPERRKEKWSLQRTEEKKEVKAFLHASYPTGRSTRSSRA